MVTASSAYVYKAEYMVGNVRRGLKPEEKIMHAVRIDFEEPCMVTHSFSIERVG